MRNLLLVSLEAFNKAPTLPEVKPKTTDWVYWQAKRRTRVLARLCLVLGLLMLALVAALVGGWL